jgi:hypothetical protein
MIEEYVNDLGGGDAGFVRVNQVRFQVIDDVPPTLSSV